MHAAIEKVDTDPDLLVNFMANEDEKTDIRSTPSSSMTMGMGYYGYRGGMYAGMPVYSFLRSRDRPLQGRHGQRRSSSTPAKRSSIWTGVAEGRLT